MSITRSGEVWTRDELDKRQQEIADAHPNGMDYETWANLSLQTTDEDGRVHLICLTERGGMATYSWGVRLWFDRLVESNGGHHKPIKYFITDKGRARLTGSTHP